MTTSLKNKTLFITGASRGIGAAIALRAAADGARIVIAAKTTEEDPRLPGTIHSVAEEIRRAGGEALALAVDIRLRNQVEAAVKKAVETFGGIDILVNNASAIHLTPTVNTPMKRFDLMHQVNVRGTFMCTQKCLPYLLKASNPHVLNLSPPLDWSPKWFAPHVAYTMSKYGMSLCVMAMAEEYKNEGIAFNALWPKTIIATAAVKNLLGGDDALRHSRKPSIVADAAHYILTQESRQMTGKFWLDEDALKAAGVDDLSVYAVTPGAKLFPDLFVA